MSCRLLINVSPINYPTVSNIDIINDHKRYIALGMAELLNNSSLADLSLSKANIENYLNGFNSKDNALFKTTAFFTNNAYLVPFFFNDNELGDAIGFAIDGSTIEKANIYSLNNTDWDLAMLEGCMFMGFEFNSYIEIPDYQSLSLTQKSKPILLVPKITDAVGELIFPITAYKWDAPNNKIIQHSIIDEDELNDLNSPFYIWYIDYGVARKADYTPSYGCSGDFAPTCGDDYCNEECGENLTWCQDCDPSKNKKLKIKKFSVVKDNRVRNFCTSGSGEKWREMISNYGIAFASVIDRPDGKLKAYTGSFGDCTPLKRSSIQLCRTKLNCSQTCNNGGPTWSVDYPKTFNGNDCAVPILDKHFNPKKSVIFICFWEDDFNKLPGLTHKKTLTINNNINYNSGSWMFGIEYNSKHTPFGAFDGNGRKFTAMDYTESNGSFVTVAKIEPNDWQNWTINPIVPSSDEIEVISPNGEFKFVLSYE